MNQQLFFFIYFQLQVWFEKDWKLSSTLNFKIFSTFFFKERSKFLFFLQIICIFSLFLEFNFNLSWLLFESSLITFILISDYWSSLSWPFANKILLIYISRFMVILKADQCLKSFKHTEKFNFVHLN